MRTYPSLKEKKISFPLTGSRYPCDVEFAAVIEFEEALHHRSLIFSFPVQRTEQIFGIYVIV